MYRCEARKNVTVESTIDSVYVKIPEKSVCVSSILEEVAVRVGMAAEDLVVLDAKFLPVSSDESGLLLVYNILCGLLQQIGDFACTHTL